MVTEQMNLSAVQGMARRAVNVSALLKNVKSVVSKKSKDRRLLSFRKTLQSFKIAHTWWGENRIIIERLPYTRPAVFIQIETLPNSGGQVPIQYFHIHAGCKEYDFTQPKKVSLKNFFIPCTTDYEVLKKLYRFKLLTFDEAIKPMLDAIKPVVK